MDWLDLGGSSSFYFRKTEIAPSPPGTREKGEGQRFPWGFQMLNSSQVQLLLVWGG